MNNLHRELAPVSDAAWAEIEAEARRTFARNVAGRRVVDLVGPAGPTLSAVGTGHVRELAPAEGVRVHQREVQSVIELRAPFSVTRRAVDDVERGAKDSDWQPVKDAATQIAVAEDRTILHGSSEAGILGIAPASSNAARSLPSETRQFPDTVAQALSATARRCRRAVQPAAVGRPLHRSCRDHRPRLPDPRPPRPAPARRRDHLGARHRRCPAPVHPRR